MKKLMALLLALATLASLAACASVPEDDPPVGSDSETEASSSDAESDSESASEDEKKENDETVYTETKYPISSNLNNIKVLGRSDVVSNGITCDFSACGIEFSARLHGDVILEVTVSEQNKEIQKNDDAYFTVYIDGERQTERLMAELGKTTKLTVASFDTVGDHTVRILKQSEIKNGLCTLKSLTFAGEFNEAPKAADSYIEFIGDSITSGYGNLCSSGTSSPQLTKYKDATQAYSYLTAEALGADHSLVSCGGIGVTKGYRIVLAKTLFQKLSYYRNTAKAYTPARTPDLVVINLGTNDKNQSADTTTFESDVKALINTVRETYEKDVPIIWVYGMMNDGYSSQIISAVTALGGADSELYTVELPRNTEGGAGHPTVDAHKAAADQLVKFIKDNDLLNPNRVSVDNKTVYAVKDNLDSIKTHGRTQLLADGISCDFSASGIEFTVNATGNVVVEIANETQNVEAHKNDDAYFTVFVDGVRQSTRYKVASGATERLTIAGFSTGGTHTIQILKQTEIKNGICTIKSISFEGTFADAPKAADKYIEFLGDSITSGYGDLCANGTSNAGDSDYKDATQAYSYLTAKALGADHSLISCGGVGITLGYRPMLAKDLFSKQSYYRSTTDAYTPERTPDLVVINLGTNDKNKSADTTTFEADVKAYIELVRSTYNKDVKIVWAYGMMNDGYHTQILSAISALGGEAAGLYSVELPMNTEGGAGHPTAAAHQTAANALVSFINEKNLLA